jgi:hypothetical protein
VRMLYAKRFIEVFRFGVGIAEARQYFRFRPKSSLVPGGG